jgi:DNA-directed RNA polymerase specialized sigma24 family protein
MDEKQFRGITNKLDLITRLLALNIVKDLKSQKEKVLALSSLGIGPTDIAESLGTTVNTVKVALSQARKVKRKYGPKGEQNDKQRDNETPA